MKKSWTIEDSDRLFQVSKWGEGYFEINEQGHLSVNPEKGKKGPKIDMIQVVEEIKAHGLEFPIVVRFHDILWFQVEQLNKTFNEVIKLENYKGKYKGVYPVKVNQMREVVEEIVEAGMPYDFGLEAGSRAELNAILAMDVNDKALTILNGHKDNEYLKLALLGTRLGKQVIIVIEKFSELERLEKISREMQIEPIIGLRSNLSMQSEGRWEDSSGERAKFGLTVPEILISLDFLKKTNLLHTLRLLHFHIGSQVTDIRCFKEAVVEASRIYSKLYKMGAKLQYIDVGGGLGIDYEGSQSTRNSSRNYSLLEYVTDIVWGIKNICDQEGVEHPHIVSESGRAITAQHSCIISNIVDVIEPQYETINIDSDESDHHLVKVARENFDILSEKNFQEVYNDNVKMKEDALNAFKLGILSLEEYSKIEGIIWKVNRKILSLIQENDSIPETLQGLEEKMAPKYFYNFSVFQSAADHWAIDQVLPIVPLGRLNEKPDRRCTLVDITCDSDGKIKHFLDSGEIRKTLPIHKVKKNEEYYIGLFLTGAYQDVMGDMHNLFGRPNEVHVFQYDDATGFYFEEIIKGSSTGNVLSSMQYSTENLARSVKKKIDKMIKTGVIGPREGVKLADFYEKSLKSYTYLH